MSARVNIRAAYRQVANAEQNRLQQVVMLYDGAISFLLMAASDITAGDLAAKGEHTSRALDIINYLQTTLDFEQGGEVAPILDLLYANVTAMILRASAALDAAGMRQAAEQLAPVRDAWAVIAGNSGAESVLPSMLNGLPGESGTLRAVL